ncbi:invasion protein IalB [Phyllobacterium sp. 1468]|uniref:invasion associated locus B family protein n=1 Tax=Phyllobacterium sp. 1468 TaxID=2817759 RepID=UPI00285601BA|nr:invasion associated locus B family protein [Phyllobacterium sp. 1468]MDR6634235.1 invasion protein IalB [Phyllobacterium sp. 1468]
MAWEYLNRSVSVNFVALALMTIGVPQLSIAQETQPPAATAPQTSGNPAGSAAPASAQPATPDVTSVKFEDWYYRCVDTQVADGKAAASCEVAQIAQVKQNGQDVNILTLAIAKTTPAPAAKGKEAKSQPAPGSELLLMALVPLNVFLPSGFSITAADKPVAQMAYRNCNQAGCWAQVNLDAKMLTALQKNSDAAGSLRLMNGQNINIKFSLKGLSAALTELQKPASK